MTTFVCLALPLKCQVYSLPCISEGIAAEDVLPSRYFRRNCTKDYTRSIVIENKNVNKNIMIDI